VGPHPAGQNTKETRSNVSICISGLLVSIIGFAGATGAVSQPDCRPALAFNEVYFSKMRPPALERKWTAVVSINASHCATNRKGYFDIVFRRLKEVGPDLEFREQFAWQPPSVKVEVDFAADEAVQTYTIDHVTACPCPG
jgi:hypothetical protein